MYAIIETGGKQYKVSKGQSIYVEKLDEDDGVEVNFDKVILIGGEKVKVGDPIIKGASVKGTVEKQGRQKKVTIFKYKPKKGASTKKGHRQPYTKVMINSIKG